jgi:hypothetical protein
MVVGRAFACTAYCELPYSVFSSSSLSSHAWWQICGPEVVRNSIIALLSQAKQSIIGARFSPTNLLLFRRTGSLDRLDRKPATIFQSRPPPITSFVFTLNKSQWWLAVHSRARPTANFHTRSLVLPLFLHMPGGKFVDQKWCGIRLSFKFDLPSFQKHNLTKRVRISTQLSPIVSNSTHTFCVQNSVLLKIFCQLLNFILTEVQPLQIL